MTSAAWLLLVLVLLCLQPRRGTWGLVHSLLVLVWGALAWGVAGADASCFSCDSSLRTDHRHLKSKRFSCGKGVGADALVPGAVEGVGLCMEASDEKMPGATPSEKSAKCCAGCQDYHQKKTFGGCDAWYMNGHECFFKLCSTAEWANGDCSVGVGAVERKDNYGSGVSCTYCEYVAEHPAVEGNGVQCNAGWGWQLSAAILGASIAYICIGIVFNMTARAGTGKPEPLHATFWRHALPALLRDGLAFTSGRLRRRQAAVINWPSYSGEAQRQGRTSNLREQLIETSAVSSSGGSTDISKKSRKAKRQDQRNLNTAGVGNGSGSIADTKAIPAMQVDGAEEPQKSTSSGSGGRWVHEI